MIGKTQAVALRCYPFSNTSRIVSWLTPDRGRLATLLKGAHRPRSMFLGQVDLFYTCELVWYPRDRGTLAIARECCPLKTRDRLRTDWKAAALASYLAGLTAQVSPPEAPHPGLFELLDDALDQVAAGTTGAPVLFWFELKLLEKLGLAPRLERCAACGALLHPSRGADFVVARGGLICPHCSGSETSGRPRAAPDVVAMMSAWQQAAAPQGPARTRLRPSQWAAVETLLGEFLAYHLDVLPQGRAIALDVLRRSLN